MPLQQRGQIDQIENVTDETGNRHPAANATEQQRTNQRLGNHPTVLDEQYTVSAADTPESLPDQPIPEGVEVAITYDPSNNGVVYVGDDSPSFPLTDVGQAVTLGVSNLSAISVKAPNTGDGVRYLVEVDS